MTTSPAPSSTSLTCAQSAAANRAGNLAALWRIQPVVADLLTTPTDDRTWLYARDGALTAQDSTGRWITDCSVPRAAARAMLESLESKAGAACFIEPTHAAQLRAAFDRLPPNQAILAIVSDAATLDFILRADDFSRELAHGRLWFAAGPDWANLIHDVLTANEGLPVPTRFIRLPVTSDDRAQSRMHLAREVFATETARRAARLDELKTAAATRTRRRDQPRICVAAPSLFHLEDNAPWLLHQALLGDPDGGDCFVHYDPDRPTDASPVALARIAGACDAIVTANIFRADAADALPPEIPWLTWVTSPRIATFRPDCPADRLLLADETFHAPARAAGWPVDRLRLATWPDLSQPAGAGEAFVLIRNTRAFDAPPAEFELSSHQVLWELIASELARDVFAIGDDLHACITRCMHRLDITEEGLNRALFIDSLIQPAYEQAVARALIHAGLPVRLYGDGWTTLDAFREYAMGAITSRRAFLDAVATARVLVHPTPVPFAGTIDALGRCVLRTAGLDQATLAPAAQRLLVSGPAVTLPSLTPLSQSLILDITRAI